MSRVFRLPRRLSWLAALLALLAVAFTSFAWWLDSRGSLADYPIVANLVAALLAIPITVLAVEFVIERLRAFEVESRNRDIHRLRKERLLDHIILIRSELAAVWGPLESREQWIKDLTPVREFLISVEEAEHPDSFTSPDWLPTLSGQLHDALDGLAEGHVDVEGLREQLERAEQTGTVQREAERAITQLGTFPRSREPYYTTRRNVRSVLSLLGKPWKWEEYEPGKWRISKIQDSGGTYLYPMGENSRKVAALQQQLAIAHETDKQCERLRWELEAEDN